jgi:gamma-glutamyl phosphate reductase
MGHLEGLCHVYLHAPVDLDMAVAVTLNASHRNLRCGRDLAGGSSAGGLSP